MITTGFEIKFFSNVSWCISGRELCFIKGKGVSWNFKIEDWQEFLEPFSRDSNYFKAGVSIAMLEILLYHVIVI